MSAFPPNRTPQWLLRSRSQARAEGFPLARRPTIGALTRLGCSLRRSLILNATSFDFPQALAIRFKQSKLLKAGATSARLAAPLRFSFPTDQFRQSSLL